MYYVLFTWIKGTKERDFQGFRTKPKLIDFLGKNFEKIVVWNIHKAEIEYHFGLYEKENKPEEGGAFVQDLTPESDEEKPADYLGSPEEKKPWAQGSTGETSHVLEKNHKPKDTADMTEEEVAKAAKTHPLLKNRKQEPSAMEKIADQIEEEKKEDITDAEILKQNKKTLGKMDKVPTLAATLSRGEKAIAAAQKEQNGTKKTWRICKRCDINRISPINRTGVCTPCQLKRKTNRPYKRKAKF
jgi:hypothetical protein